MELDPKDVQLVLKTLLQAVARERVEKLRFAPRTG
jgi:hypothetical protein